MSPSLLDFLRHIANECEYLVQLKQDRDREELLDDPTKSRAIVRSLEVIGEAVKKLPAEFRGSYPQVDWADMAGMRDVLIHHYFGIDYDIVWDVLQNEIPDLHHELLRIIALESDEQ
jgi:uncharacterized protein with HEPN domain